MNQAALLFPNDSTGRAGRPVRSNSMVSTSAFAVFVTMDLDGELIGGFASFKLNSCQSVI